MRKYIYGSLFAAVCMLVAGCQNNGIVLPETDPEIIAEYSSLEELVSEGIEVDHAEQTVSFKVHENAKWTLSSNQTWCSASPAAGSAYSIISINLTANPLDIERVALLSFTVTGQIEPSVITVTQGPGVSSLVLNATKLDFGVGAGTQNFRMTTNSHEWVAEVIDNGTGEAATWIILNTPTGSGNHDFAVTASDNLTGEVRNATFTVSAVQNPDIKATVNISQLDNLATPELTLDTGDRLNLTWDNIVGVKYDLIIRNGEDKTTATVMETVTLSENTSSYDLTEKAYPGNYIGKVWLELRTYAQLSDGLIENFSNIVGSHNYFDDASGDGTEGSEYIVTNRRHLNNVRRFLAAHYKQTADIDMAEFTFLPVSQSLTGAEFAGEFTGVYDAGSGSVEDTATGRTSGRYKISNLTLNQSGSKNVGLFALVGTAGMVRNLEMENCTVGGNANIGAFAGTNHGTVVSCHNTGATASVSSSSGTSGGIVGYNYGSVSYCTNAATISSTTGAMQGGIIGQNVVSATGPNIEIAFCSNTGAISGTTQTGGIIGDATPHISDYKTIIRDSYNKGAITSTAVNSQSGGIIGRTFISAEILRCYNTGTVNAAGSAGGILGRLGNGYTLLIKDCYNRGNITSTGAATNGNSNAAGILPTNQSTNATGVSMVNCYNAGTVANSNGFYNGLFQRKSAPGVVMIAMGDCYAVNEDGKKQTETTDIISATPVQGSTATYTNVSAADMSQQATFANWNFTSVWEMGAGMPKLKGLPE